MPDTPPNTPPKQNPIAVAPKDILGSVLTTGAKKSGKYYSEIVARENWKSGKVENAME